MLAVIQAGDGDVQLQILLHFAAGARNERHKPAAEKPGRVELTERRDLRPATRVDGARKETNVPRHAVVGTIGPGDASVHRTEIRPFGIAADNWLDVVIAIAADERP